MIIVIVISWVLAILQIIFFNFLSFGIFGINILLISFLILMAFEKNYYALILAGVGGIFLDIFSGTFFGIWTISFLIIYIIFYFANKISFLKNFYILMFVFFVLNYLHSIIYYLLLIFSGSEIQFSIILWPSFLSSLTSVVLFLIVLPYFKKYQSKNRRVIIEIAK